MCRQQKEREAIFLMDNGQAAPLYPKGDSYPWGTMHGTEALDLPELRYWKSTAVRPSLPLRISESKLSHILVLSQSDSPSYCADLIMISLAVVSYMPYKQAFHLANCQALRQMPVL